MKIFKPALQVILFCLIAATVSAQVTKVPQAAKDNFAKQYPNAKNVGWDNDLLYVQARFELNGETMMAEYNNKGIWKKTERKINYDNVPEVVKDGFNKSKYADREVTETVLVELPGDVIQYRFKTEKNDLQKKYLFFDKRGRLVRDAITL